MMLAQQLYEGIDLGKKEGTVGLITYMRTDSTRISDVAKEEAAGYIKVRMVISTYFRKSVKKRKIPMHKMRMKRFDLLVR